MKYKYPNLNSIVLWHPYHSSTFASHAEVTPELFEAVLKGDEGLTDDEFRRISRLVNIPVGLLKQPYIARLNNKKFQHRKKVDDLAYRYETIKCLRTKKGYGNCSDLRITGEALEDFIKAFEDHGSTFCRYRAVLYRIEWQEWLYIHRDGRKPRGLK